MIEKIPEAGEMTGLLGKDLYDVWGKLCALIEERYDMERIWNEGGKAWTYEYKYRRGGKTLCALYGRERAVGFLIIFGKQEREKFEAMRGEFSEEALRVYDEARTYHDGKWVMFEPTDTSLFGDFMKMLQIKRRGKRGAEGNPQSLS